MSFLRHSATRVVRKDLFRSRTLVPRRQYTASHSPKSNTPWAIGSLLVFGPLLFHLTSPPPPRKKVQEHVQSVKEQVETVQVIPKPYVLIGGGTASFSAAQAIKEKDPKANVIIVSEEGVAPYMRPPLSKEFWFSDDAQIGNTLNFKDWQGNERNIVYRSKDDYELIEDASGSDLQTDKTKLLLNKKVTGLNVEEHSITLDDGSEIYYHKVLIATGGEPKKLSMQEESDQVTTFRTVRDFQQLDQIAKEGAHIAVIGGGFLGSELAVALAHRENLKVTQIFPEDGNMANVFPNYLTKWTTTRVRHLGVDIKEKSKVQSIKKDQASGKTTIQLENGDHLDVDHVIVAIGIEPRVDLARKAGLEIDEKRSGVVVNAELEARTDVYAAGDMISFYDSQLGRRRIEHHDHAVLSGRHAGANMVGAARPYEHQSMFWSDLGPEIGYEAVGLIDSQLSTVSVWAKATAKDTPAAAVASEADSPRTTGEATAPSVTEEVMAKNPFENEKFGKGLVFYVREKQIVGLVLFNVFGKVKEAREIINAGHTSDHIDSLLKQFDLYANE
ncbi:apoptosis-inducing factor, mitochondrion-associated, C-term-domain-containing protein [Pilobolus umbonatus]|nr:apoptosis-inducing factor, mitochondrion-associated, C-term-domain-containing protein [Pilobolus umbonatus]